MGKDAEPSDEEKVDIAELAEQAKVVAKATGRTEEDVMEDLLDDGIVNLSNEQKQDKDLVTQLKEAAELITTVQQVNKEVSENSVLNGGENKTDVKIETTLEGDIVDRAIESVQRKADNIKKLMATLIPVLLIFTGGSLEAFGVTNMFGGDDDSEVTYDDDCSIWFHETWYEWVDDGTDPPDLQFHLSADTDCETPQYINFGVELNAWGYENTESARVSLDEPPVWVVIGFGDVDGPDDPNYHLADLRIYDDGGDWDQTFMDVWKTIEKFGDAQTPEQVTTMMLPTKMMAPVNTLPKKSMVAQMMKPTITMMLPPMTMEVVSMTRNLSPAAPTPKPKTLMMRLRKMTVHAPIPLPNPAKWKSTIITEVT